MRNILRFDELDSTITYAKQHSHSLADKTIIIAKRQTAGRGRFDRKWDSQEGGLYLGIWLQPRKTDFLANLTQLTALSVCLVLRKLGAQTTEDFNGYSMPQEAYQQTDSLTNLNYRFIYPVAGGSNQGIYRYSREYPDRLYTAGMDVNLSAYSAHITFSTVKRIDQIVKQYINRLCTEGTFGDTLHTTYGIAERYADIDWVEGYEDSYKELINYYYPIVTEKEQEYEQNFAEEGGESHE